MASELSSRERIWRALHHQEADRVGIMERLWDTTLDRWYGEGLPKEPTPSKIFNWDMQPIAPDLSFRFPTILVEETDEYTIVRDKNGSRVKNWKHSTSTPGWMGHIIETRADWEEHKGRLEWDDARVDWDATWRLYNEARAREQFVYYEGLICWDAAVKAVSAETILYAMADDPEWIRDMFRVYTDLYLAGAEAMIAAGFEFDGAWVYDDMGYRNATLFSPRTYVELIFPNDKRVCGFFNARDMPVILHSCGQVSALIPRLIEAGYACLQPLEVKAGMDLRELKKKYGDELAFMGGIDVRAMGDPNPQVIEREIATKIPVAMQGGGYVYHSDHSVPDSVSLEQYRHMLELLRRYGTYQDG